MDPFLTLVWFSALLALPRPESPPEAARGELPPIPDDVEGLLRIWSAG